MEILHRPAADVLPLDYKNDGDEIETYITKSNKRAEQLWKSKSPDFAPATASARRFAAAGQAIAALQSDPATSDVLAKVNRGLIDAERALLIPEGLPNRPWFRPA